MANYAKGLPRDDKGSEIMPDFPAPVKATQTFAGTLTVSSVITFLDNDTQIEIGTAGGSGVAIRWIPTTETASVSPFASVISSGVGANFDHYIPPNWARQFVIPRETKTITSIVGINIREGLYRRVAWVSGPGAASSSFFGTTY